MGKKKGIRVLTEGVGNVNSISDIVSNCCLIVKTEDKGTRWSRYRIITPKAADEMSVRSSLVRNMASLLGTSSATYHPAMISLKFAGDRCSRKGFEIE